MLYEVRTKLSESGRRVRLERLDMDHEGLVVDGRRVAWQDVSSFREAPWMLTLRNGATLSVVEGRPKHHPMVVSFFKDAAQHITQWNVHVPEASRITRDLHGELTHHTRQIVGLAFGMTLGLALLIVAVIVPTPISAMIYIGLVSALGFCVLLGAHAFDKRLQLKELIKKQP